jgi:endo-1,4-beta-xylanase
LKFSSTITHLDHDQISLTLTATNGDVGPAYTTQISGLTIEQTDGWRRCSPTITAPGAYPIALGDLAVSGTASATFTISFAGCDDDARFRIEAPWSSAVYETGTYEREIHERRDHDGWHSR